MWELLDRFLSTQFIPHSHCYLWQTPLVGLQAISDLVIVLADFSIPLLLFYFIRQRQDVPINRILILFSAFIFSCGITHLMSIINLWYSWYWVSGFLKAASALISLATAIELYLLMPQLLTIPSPKVLQKEIKERQKIETQLRDSQQLLKFVFDTLPQRVFWKDRNLKYLGCNHKLAEDAGLQSTNEIVGKDDSELGWTQTEVELYRQRDIEVIENNQPDLHRIEQRSSVNGSFIWVDSSQIPLHNHEGNVIGVLGTYEDITERRKVADALRSAQQDFRTIFDNVDEAIFIHNLQGKIIDVNQRMLTLFGITKEQALQLSIEKDLSSPQNSFHQLRDIWQRAVAGEQILFEWKSRKPLDGSLFDVEVFLRQVKLNHQDVLLASLRDITTRKQTEIALNQQLQLAAFRAEIDTALTREETLFKILKRCTDAIVKHLNAAFARIWIFNPTENVLELQASSGIYTHLNGEHSRIGLGEHKIGSIAQTRQPHLVNNVLSDPQISDPQWAQCEGMVAFAGYPLVVKERLFGVIALFARYQLPEKTLEALSLAADEIALGISRKQAEMALQQSEAQLRQRATELQQTLQQLEQTQTQLIQSEKMSALGQMMAGIAHEINNPVSFIGGNLAFAQNFLNDITEHLRLYQQQFSDPGEMITEHQEKIDLDYILTDFHQVIASMKVGVERIRGISTSLRIFSRADQEEKILFNIQEGIESTLMILKHRLMASKNHPEIHVIQDYQNIPMIPCYPGQLNQVFMNILANAIDAFDESPESSQDCCQDYCQIYIQTELINPEKAVLIRIQDNGPGISKEIQQKVFDYLFTTKPVGKGTGLGLSISRQIIEQKHQGTLAVASEVGVGTEFMITLPLSS